MNLADITTLAISPALSLLLQRMDSRQARVQLLATGLQESRFTARRQHGNGPARGFWQFERGGGVVGVLTHAASKPHMLQLCERLSLAADAQTVWTALEYQDVLAAAAARLLYWTDPKPLPALGDAEGAWALYLRTWRPGKPHRATWDAFYNQAIAHTG